MGQDSKHPGAERQQEAEGRFNMGGTKMNDNKRSKIADDLLLVLDVADIRRIMGISGSAYEAGSPRFPAFRSGRLIGSVKAFEAGWKGYETTCRKAASERMVCLYWNAAAPFQGKRHRGKTINDLETLHH